MNLFLTIKVVDTSISFSKSLFKRTFFPMIGNRILLCGKKLF